MLLVLPQDALGELELGGEMQTKEIPQTESGQEIWQKQIKTHDYGEIGDDGDVLVVLLAFQEGLGLASLQLSHIMSRFYVSMSLYIHMKG